MAGATAQMPVPAANSSAAVTYAPRGPTLCRSRAHSAAPMMDATTNNVVFQAYRSSPPMSATTDGRMVVTMNTLTACSATPPARITARAPLRPPSRAPQPSGRPLAGGVLTGRRRP